MSGTSIIAKFSMSLRSCMVYSKKLKFHCADWSLLNVQNLWDKMVCNIEIYFEWQRSVRP